MKSETELNEEALQQILDRDFPKGKRWGMFAFKQGWRAAHRYVLRSDCPYDDKRTWDGKITFSRAYRRQWFKGYDAGVEWRKERSKVATQKKIEWFQWALSLDRFGVINTAITSGFSPDWKNPLDEVEAKAKFHLAAQITKLEFVRGRAIE